VAGKETSKVVVVFQPIVLLHAVWLAIGMILSSVCLSICLWWSVSWLNRSVLRVVLLWS